MSLSRKKYLSIQDILFAIQTHFAVVFKCEVECKARDTFCFRPCRDLQAFYDARIALVFQSRVFSFSVFTNYGEVDVGVSSRKTGQRLTEDNGGVNIELLSHGDVP